MSNNLAFLGLNKLNVPTTLLISTLVISGCSSSTPDNKKPKAKSKTIELLEDGMKVISLEASDDDSDPLTYAMVDMPQHGVFDLTSKTYTPSNNYHGADQFTFKANDGTSDSDVATISITVMPVNDMPTTDSSTLSLDEDIEKIAILEATDIDEDNLTYFLVSEPAHGTFDITTKTYTPNADYNGADSFTFKVNDGTVDSEPANITVTVSSVNDAPVATAQTVDVVEDTPRSITLEGTDIDGDSLTYLIVTPPAHGTFDGARYTPNANYQGNDSFTFKAYDGTSDSAPATVSLTVSNLNDAPIATSQTVNLVEDTPKAITLSGTDIDNDIDSLTFSIVTQPSHGTFDGTTYTPVANYHGDDSFTFKVNDGTSDSAPATVSLTISSVNDAPTVKINTNATGRVLPDYEVTFTANAEDLDGTIASYSWAEGTTVLSTAASFDKNDFTGGEHIITLTVEDNEGASSAKETVTINVWEPTVIGETEDFGVGGDVYDIALSSDGKRAYLASNAKGLTIVNIEDPMNPVVVNSFDTGVDVARGVSLSADGSKAYIADYGQGLKIIDLSDESNLQLLGEFSAVSAFDIETYVLADNRVIAYLLDRTKWLRIIDITDPANPILHGELDLGSITNKKLRLSNDGSRAYATGGSSGVDIINVSDIDVPVLVANISTSANDIRVSTDNKILYVAGAENSTPGNEGFGIFNIDESDVNFKELVASYSTVTNVSQRGIAIHQKDGKDLAYLFETGNGVQIIDITNPATPSKIISKNTEGAEEGGAISQDGTKAYIIYGPGVGYNGLKVMDIDIPLQLE